MKSCLATTLLALFAVGGCSADGPERIDTTGDHPALGAAEPMTPAAISAEVDTGRLLVYTPRNADSAPFSGYKVYDEAGRSVAHETNQAGGRAEGPVELKLAPGRYFVRLDEPGQGLREFWVSVERGKVTRVENKSWSGTPAYVR